MSELNKVIVEFDVNKEQLETIKQEALAVDRNDITQVKEVIKKLVKVRRGIQDKGKDYRDDANAFNKMVIAKEKEYVSIIEPVEVEYKELVEKDEQRKILEARKALLPMKKEQLQLLKVLQPTDEQILSLSDEEWIVFYQSKLDEHKKQIAHEEELERKEKERKEREEQIKKEAEEKAEKEKKDLIAKAEKDKAEAVENAKRQAEDKALKEKQEREESERREKEAEEARLKKEQDEIAKLEAGKKYKAFLSENNFNEETDIIKNDGDNAVIYRFVAKFNLKK